MLVIFFMYADEGKLGKV